MRLNLTPAPASGKSHLAVKPNPYASHAVTRKYAMQAVTAKLARSSGKSITSSNPFMLNSHKNGGEYPQ